MFLSMFLLLVVVDFKVDTGKPLSNGAVAGIVVAACAVFALLVVIILRLTGYLGGKEDEENGKRKHYTNLFQDNSL